MKKKIILSIFLLSVLFSCARHYDYNEIKTIFDSNKQDIILVKDVFYNNQSIFQIARRNYDKISYYLVCRINGTFKQITFPINISDKKDEFDFIRTNIKNIQSYASASLSQYLLANGISEDELIQIIEIMISTNIYAIHKDIDDGYILISISQKEGLIFSKENLEKIKIGLEVKRINSDWYFFKDTSAFL